MLNTYYFYWDILCQVLTKHSVAPSLFSVNKFSCKRVFLCFCLSVHTFLSSILFNSLVLPEFVSSLEGIQYRTIKMVPDYSAMFLSHYSYAGAIFADACLKGLNGVPEVVECSYVQSSITELPFFSSKVIDLIFIVRIFLQGICPIYLCWLL